jgi:putative spermidine/putrescine transport system permease protein
MKKLAPFLFITFAVLPLAAGLTYAILYSVGLAGALSSGFSMEYWRVTLTDSTFWWSIFTSAAVALVVLSVATMLALWGVLWLRAPFEKPVWRFLLHFPLAVPPIVAAFLGFQWLGSTGVLARMTYALGWTERIETFPALINDTLYLGVMMVLVLSTFPFLLLVFLQHHRSARVQEMCDLAATLGASAWHIALRVVAPVLLRRAQPALLLYGIFLFGAFEVPLLLGSQHPAMISLFIHQKFSRYNLADLPVAYVATVVYALVLMVSVALFFRLERRNTTGLSA